MPKVAGTHTVGRTGLNPRRILAIALLICSLFFFKPLRAADSDTSAKPDLIMVVDTIHGADGKATMQAKVAGMVFTDPAKLQHELEKQRRALEASGKKSPFMLLTPKRGAEYGDLISAYNAALGAEWNHVEFGKSQE